MKIIKNKLLLVLSAVITALIGIVSFMWWHSSKTERILNYHEMPEYGVRNDNIVAMYGVRPKRPEHNQQQMVSREGVLGMLNANNQTSNGEEDKKDID